MKSISRRDFLKGALASSVSLAAAGVIGAPVFAAEGGKYTPGTYSAKAKGIASDVEVTMTFDENSITDVVIDVSGETPDIGGAIGEDMAKAILDAQSADIDAVTGATVTSDAIRTAAADCISQASGAEVVLTEKEEGSSDWLGEAPEIADADIT
ncbi:MAG: FMN-binding protein, partial [Lachnospiraceae bacterium]|nr:FMN-binding protein [Lachnospiraceae bacterium]